MSCQKDEFRVWKDGKSTLVSLLEKGGTPRLDNGGLEDTENKVQTSFGQDPFEQTRLTT